MKKLSVGFGGLKDLLVPVTLDNLNCKLWSWENVALLQLRESTTQMQHYCNCCMCYLFGRRLMRLFTVDQKSSRTE